MRHSTGRPPGVTRTLVQAAALLLACLTHLLTPTPGTPTLAPSPATSSSPAEPHLPPPPAPRVRPYLLAHEQRMRRRAPLLTLDGIGIGPKAIHGHRAGVAA
ncbi:hypothetical protein [Streptomyces sp. ST1015]|uniref:hypothetical protein n=1 Tax=Streptomyces sp. ST1015 TaxID=1848900 RepID=UPI001CA777EB|nr:hypothetical protein [Streptomyces sp. ST1015]QZZ29245.1 hypothetical protein A7X85_26010 [Streptomyces sp. ST1015]